MGNPAMVTRDDKHTGNREERLNLRVTAREKRLLERAAEASHATSTQFILQAALRSAEDVLAEETRFALEPEQWSAFAAMLDRPARAIPALTEAASKPSPFSDR